MRILIDTSFISLHGRPVTGIPRVVKNYQLLGYLFGKQRGIEVMPVTFSDENLVLQRASSLFPHPESLALSRRRAWPLFLLLMHYITTGAAYAAYGMPYYFRVLWERLRSGEFRPDEIGNRMEPLFTWLQRPGAFFWERYMRTALVEPRPNDILFCPAYWHDIKPEIYKKLRGKIRAMYVLIHDVIPATHPQYYRSPWCYEFRDNVEHALNTFTGVIPISGYTADMLHSLFPAAASGASISVCHNGLDPMPQPDDPSGRLAKIFDRQTPPYLMVGTIEPKKGHRRVLESLEKLWAEGATKRKLVILGRKGWMYDDIVTRFKRSKFPENVVWLSDTNDSELSYAYQNAHALIHASEVEGFGLPLIEAAASETPVLSIDTPIATEIAGSFASFYSDEIGSLSAALIALEDAGEYQRRKAAVEQFHWSEWEIVVPALFGALVANAQDGTPLPDKIQV